MKYNKTILYSSGKTAELLLLYAARQKSGHRVIKQRYKNIMVVKILFYFNKNDIKYHRASLIETSPKSPIVKKYAKTQRRKAMFSRYIILASSRLGVQKFFSGWILIEKIKAGKVEPIIKAD